MNTSEFYKAYYKSNAISKNMQIIKENNINKENSIPSAIEFNEKYSSFKKVFENSNERHSK